MNTKTKIVRGVKLTDSELCKVVFNQEKETPVFSEEVIDTVGSTSIVFTTIKVDDKFFAISWEKDNNKYLNRCDDKLHETFPEDLAKLRKQLKVLTSK